MGHSSDDGHELQIVGQTHVHRPALVIDCAEIGKAKNDAGLISALAEQTGKCAGNGS